MCFSVALFAQYITPWGISPLAAPPNAQTAATQISSFSLGGIVSSTNHEDQLCLGLQQTGLDVYISLYDTLDIDELGQFSVYDDSPIAYILQSEALGPQARFDIQADEHRMGEYSWDDGRQIFIFTPNPSISEFCDTVIFTAFTDTDTISREIHFNYIPRLPYELNAMGLSKTGTQDKAVMNDVVSLIDESDSSLHIAGRTLLFDLEQDDQGLCEYSAQGDADARFNTLRHVYIYADSILIHEALRFPACEVIIYARTLVFDDPNASINTSPFRNKIPNSGASASEDGRDAGDIHLFTGDLQMGPGGHFILNGSDGQSVTTGAGVPSGNGGNGGNLRSPVYIPPVNYSIQAGAPGENGTDQTYGSTGSFVKGDWFPEIWVHARNIQPEVNYIRFQYMENNLEYVRNRCESLNQLLARKFASVEVAMTSDDADLMNAQNQIRDLQNRLRSQLDYYGNPIGWVPLLSFEVYQGVFESEVDNAFNLMFLSYLINKADANIEQVSNGMKSARSSMIGEVTALQGRLGENIRNLETYENIYDQLRRDADALRGEMKTMEERLLKDAEANAEKERKMAFFKSIASVGGSILSMRPIPGCQVLGQGVSLTSKLDYKEPFSLENASLVVEASENAYSSYISYNQDAIQKFGSVAIL